MLYQSNLFILNALDLSSVLSLSLHLFLIRLRNKAALFKLSTSSNLSLITETYAKKMIFFCFLEGDHLKCCHIFCYISYVESAVDE